MTDPERASAWTGLRQRKVVQWSLAYAAVAWALLQVCGFAATSVSRARNWRYWRRCLHWADSA